VKNTVNAHAKSDPESLYSQIKNYKFLVSLIVWHSLLFEVNYMRNFSLIPRILLQSFLLLRNFSTRRLAE